MHVSGNDVLKSPSARSIRALVGGMLMFFAPGVFGVTPAMVSGAAAVKPGVMPIPQVPVRFERNDGQVHPEVHYLTRGRGYTLFLTGTEAVLSLAGDRAAGQPAAVVRMRFVGADPEVPVRGVAAQTEKRNYLIGNDPARWHTNVPTFSDVAYDHLYPGVDLVFHSARQALEYDFIVKPGTRPETITMQITGGELHIDERGNLVINAGGRELVQQAPLVYQVIDGKRELVTGRFILKDNSHVGFQVAAYDAARELVIDPVISYSTLYGGSGDDSGKAIAVNTTGIYITGETDSIDFPTSTGTFQPLEAANTEAFVVKLDSFGASVQYSTYLGGNDDDSGAGIAVDSSGNAIVTGATLSADFPTLNANDSICGSGSSCDGGVSDAFVTKLNAAGDGLVFSTFLGDSAEDSGTAIAVDTTGNAYVGGQTFSGGFPKQSAYQSTYGGSGDGFVSKFSSTGLLTYSTFLGGSNEDSVSGIAVDGVGSAYVTGVTFSTDFPKTAGAFQQTQSGAGDAFVTKFSTAGNSVTYSTYLGGINFDRGFGIGVDASGNAYVTGATVSVDFPTANPVQSAHATGGTTRDAFITKVNSTGTDLTWSTFIGGDGTDVGNAIAVSSAGLAFVAGQTLAPDFPVSNAMQPYLLGSSDAFVVGMTSAGALSYATYLGGTGTDLASGIALDAANVAHIVGQAARPDTTPLTTNQIADAYAGSDAVTFPSVQALQSSLRGTSDAFIARIATTSSADLKVTKTDNSISSVIAGTAYTSTVTVTNNGPNIANDIVVVDTQPISFDLPLPLTVNSASASQGTCSEADNVVVCNLGNLTSGASATVDLSYTPDTAGDYTRTALIVRALESDPVLDDNLATIVTRVVSSGGGGGAMPPVLLAILGGWLPLCQRLYRKPLSR